MKNRANSADGNDSISASDTASANTSVRHKGLLGRQNNTIVGVTRITQELLENREQKKDLLELARIYLKTLVHRSWYGAVYINLLIVLSIFSCMEFIAETYMARGSHQFRSLEITEKMLAAVFTFDWFLFLFIVDHKFSHICSFYSIIDLLTVIPIWVTFNKFPLDYRDVHTSHEVIMYILFGLRTTRILRILRLRVYLANIKDVVRRAISDMALVCAAMVLFNSALMQYLEYHVQPFYFHTWTYYVWITIATVGSGDVVPVTVLGRFFAMVMIMIAIIFVPRMSNEVIEKMNLQSIYKRLVYRSKGRHSMHVVICGHVQCIPLKEFLIELFHEDHDNEDLNAVILCPEPPSMEILLMLQDPVLNGCMLYLQGSAMNDIDLQRACANEAIAIFLMTDKYSPTPDEIDAGMILQHRSIKNYIVSTTSDSSSPLYVLQLIRPENRRHMLSVSAKTTIVCLNEIKMGILAKSIIYPGATTLIMNLLSSFADDSYADSDSDGDGDGDGANDDDDVDILTLNDDKLNVHVNTSTSTYKTDWLTEYKRGCEWEIYTTVLASVFVGLPFATLSNLLYQKVGIVLFGLYIHDTINDTDTMALNPYDFIIPPEHSDYCVGAFVLAKNKTQSDLSFKRKEGKWMKTLNIIKSNIAMHPFIQQQRQTFDGNRAYPMPTGSSSKGVAVVADGRERFNSATSRKYSHNMYSHSHASRVHVTNQESILHDQPQHQQQQQVIHTDRRRRSKRRSTNFTHTNTYTNVSFNLGRRSSRAAMAVGSLGNIHYRHAVNKASAVHTISSSRGSSRGSSATVDSAANAQEALKALEDLHNKKSYYLRKSTVTLSDCTINTHVTVEVPHINNHLIVIANTLGSCIHDLVRPLRARYLKSFKYIVILSLHVLPHVLWQKIATYDGILFVQGSALEEDDLIRAGIFRARKVLMLTDNTKSTLTSLSDSDAIFCYQAVRRLNPIADIVVEIVGVQNIDYLTDTDDNVSGQFYKLNPSFTSGSLFTSSLLDTLVCQSFYNPTIIKVVNMLASGVDELNKGMMSVKATATALRQKTSNSATDRRKRKLSVATPTTNSSTQDTTIDHDDSDGDSDGDGVASLRIPVYGIHTHRQTQGGIEVEGEAREKVDDSDTSTMYVNTAYDKLVRGIKRSHLYQITVPMTEGTLLYGTVYKYLTGKGILPLGILRSHNTNTGASADSRMTGSSNALPYVYTNPDKKCELFESDRIFVLSVKPLMSAALTGSADLDAEVNHDLLMHIAWLQNRKNKVKFADNIKDDIRNIQQSQADIENKLDSLEKSMDKFIDVMTQQSLKMEKKWKSNKMGSYTINTDEVLGPKL